MAEIDRDLKKLLGAIFDMTEAETEAYLAAKRRKTHEEMCNKAVEKVENGHMTEDDEKLIHSTLETMRDEAIVNRKKAKALMDKHFEDESLIRERKWENDSAALHINAARAYIQEYNETECWIKLWYIYFRAEQLLKQIRYNAEQLDKLSNAA